MPEKDAKETTGSEVEGKSQTWMQPKRIDGYITLELCVKAMKTIIELSRFTKKTFEEEFV
jgi:hypothetical protein